MNKYAPITIRELYRWIEDQIADHGDAGVGWETLRHFGRTVTFIDPVLIDCAVGDLLNSGRIRRNRNGLLIVP